MHIKDVIAIKNYIKLLVFLSILFYCLWKNLMSYKKLIIVFFELLNINIVYKILMYNNYCYVLIL